VPRDAQSVCALRSPPDGLCSPRALYPQLCIRQHASIGIDLLPASHSRAARAVPHRNNRNLAHREGIIVCPCPDQVPVSPLTYLAVRAVRLVVGSAPNGAALVPLYTSRLLYCPKPPRIVAPGTPPAARQQKGSPRAETSTRWNALGKTQASWYISLRYRLYHRSDALSTCSRRVAR